MPGGSTSDQQTPLTLGELDDMLRREVRSALVASMRKKSPHFISAGDAATTERIVNYLLDWGALDGIAEKLRVADDIAVGTLPRPFDDYAGSSASNYRSIPRGCE